LIKGAEPRFYNFSASQGKCGGFCAEIVEKSQRYPLVLECVQFSFVSNKMKDGNRLAKKPEG